MKELFKTYMNKGVKELEDEVRAEFQARAKNWISVSLGKEKKTHLLSQASKKIAFLKTLINQKKFMAKESVSNSVGPVVSKAGL